MCVVGWRRDDVKGKREDEDWLGEARDSSGWMDGSLRGAPLAHSRADDRTRGAAWRLEPLAARPLNRGSASPGQERARPAPAAHLRPL